MNQWSWGFLESSGNRVATEGSRIIRRGWFIEFFHVTPSNARSQSIGAIDPSSIWSAPCLCGSSHFQDKAVSAGKGTGPNHGENYPLAGNRTFDIIWCFASYWLDLLNLLNLKWILSSGISKFPQYQVTHLGRLTHDIFTPPSGRREQRKLEKLPPVDGMHW